MTRFKRELLIVLVIALLVSGGTFAFADKSLGETSGDDTIADIIASLKDEVDMATTEVLTKDIGFLLGYGFTDKEIIALDGDIRVIANIIRGQDMSFAEIENLKQGFLNNRPTFDVEYEEVDMKMLSTTANRLDRYDAVVAAAAAPPVRITLPAFTVTLNGAVVDSSKRQYPLLVYNDITYVPMTFHDCRFMGLETEWYEDPEQRPYCDELSITRTGAAGSYNDYAGNVLNSSTGQATLPAFAVFVNGQFINSTTEEYPLLVYRDVTYFPLTWRFAVDEFGWEYSFDSINGLQINSDGN